MEKSKPVVLVFSAHDPSGAAGLQADIESINENNGHCVSIVTAVTAQNTSTFESILPQSPASLRTQAEILLSDIAIDACKIGLIGSDLLIFEISDLLENMIDLPLVLDPVLHAGTGTNLTSEDINSALLEKLIPLTTVLTPNMKEAFRLTGKNNMQAAANELIAKGCDSVLITGADQSTTEVVNTLYINNQNDVEFKWERLPGNYHGSGCTLASAISAQLAQKKDIQTAVEIAQKFTWETLKHGQQIGKSQIHPNRLFLNKNEQDDTK